MPYEYQPYPCWRYHREKPPVIVNDPGEEAELGEGWADTPAKFLEPEPEQPAPAAEPIQTPKPKKASSKKGQ